MSQNLLKHLALRHGSDDTTVLLLCIIPNDQANHAAERKVPVPKIAIFSDKTLPILLASSPVP